MLSLYDKMEFQHYGSWSINYKEESWNQGNKLNVVIIPHSHCDPGWLMTFDVNF